MTFDPVPRGSRGQECAYCDRPCLQSAHVSRLFFALWPDEAVSAALAGHRDTIAAACQGRATLSDTLHMTLVFAGQVDDERVPLLRECGGRVRSSQFAMFVDRRSGFSRAKVAWLGCSSPPTALDILQSALQQQVENAGFVLDNRPFCPQITMARHGRCTPADGVVPSIEWEVQSFVLVHSRAGPRGPDYRVLQEWKLAA